MVPRAPKNPLIAIVGATGTGKSNVGNHIKDEPLRFLTVKLAVFLAERYNGEIVNGDALQLYEGLRIATNKIPEKEQKGIPHHLLGCIDLKEQPWTVAKFVSEARRIIEQVKAREKIPFLVGGTNYYTQALLFPGIHIEQDVHPVSDYEQEDRWPILKQSNERILEELWRVDPAIAARWHPNDTRKIRRSLEIWLQTGRTASEIYAQQRACFPEIKNSDNEGMKRAAYDSLIFWMHSEAEILNARLAKRVDDMVRDGLLAEIQCMDELYQRLIEKGVQVDTSKGIWVAIGYKEFEDYLKGIRNNMSDAHMIESKKLGIEKTIIASRQYAKRQVRWIRLKLMKSLQEARSENRMFLLDTSQVGDWSLAVEQKASKVMDDYLLGTVPPDPKTLSKAAATVLTQEQVVVAQHHHQVNKCKLCGIHTTTSHDWQQHLRGKRHKHSLRGRQQGACRPLSR